MKLAFAVITALFGHGRSPAKHKRRWEIRLAVTLCSGVMLLGTRTVDAQSRPADDSPLVQAARKGRLPERAAKYALLKPGMQAPAISASEWYNTDQRVELGGRPVLLNFFATTCRPCVESLPLLHDLAQRYRSELRVISVHAPAGREKMQSFLAEHDITLPIAIDTGATRATFGVTGVPTYFLIDSHGVVLLKTHRVPRDHTLRTSLGLPTTGSPSALTSIARKPRLTRRSITIVPIDPIAPGEPFRGIAASRWFNSPPLNGTRLRGKVVLIDFWGYWCLPCVDKLPALQAYADQFGPALTVVGVHYSADAASVASFLSQKGIRFPVALDTGETWKAHSINYLPTYLLVDSTGVVRFNGKSLPEVHQIASLLAAAKTR